MKLDLVLHAAAKARVEAAVRAAEAKSEGQIVPVVVGRSVPHGEAIYRAGLLGAALTTALLISLHPEISPLLFVSIQGAGLLLGFLAAQLSPIERLLLGRRALESAAWDRARRAFLEHGLDRTAKRTGILVFASLFERTAIVLGDTGIHEKVGDDGWKQAVALLVVGIRRGAVADGFCDAIAACGQSLALHFPRAGGPHPDELPDQLQIDQ
jgi:putative membrane protein